MHKNFDINWTKIKAGCQLGRKVVNHNSKSLERSNYKCKISTCMAVVRIFKQSVTLFKSKFFEVIILQTWSSYKIIWMFVTENCVIVH